MATYDEVFAESLNYIPSVLATFENDNNIFINPPSDIVGNLQPHGSAEDSFTKPFGKKPKFKLLIITFFLFYILYYNI